MTGPVTHSPGRLAASTWPEADEAARAGRWLLIPLVLAVNDPVALLVRRAQRGGERFDFESVPLLGQG